MPRDLPGMPPYTPPNGIWQGTPPYSSRLLGTLHPWATGTPHPWATGTLHPCWARLSDRAGQGSPTVLGKALGLRMSSD